MMMGRGSSLIKMGLLVVVLSKDLNSEERSDHEKGGPLRKIENGVPCAIG